MSTRVDSSSCECLLLRTWRKKPTKREAAKALTETRDDAKKGLANDTGLPPECNGILILYLEIVKTQLSPALEFSIDGFAILSRSRKMILSSFLFAESHPP